MQVASTPQCIEYVISVDPMRFGQIARISETPVDTSAEGVTGKRCYEVMHARREPCTNCPAARVAPRGSPQREVSAEYEGYSLVEASAREDGLVQVHKTRIDLEALRALTREHLRETARKSGLSARELDVLDYLARGVDLTGIAKRLGIQPRTVKFHQTNLLRKLKLGSRADLIRLLT